LARIRRLIVDPSQPRSIIDQLTEMTKAVDGGISFGDPQDPTNPTSTTLAGSSASAHAGNIQNIEGGWASANVVALDTAVTLYHNIDCPVSVAGRPNVRVLAFWWEHDGWDGVAVSSATAIATVSYNFQTGDTVTASSIRLRFYAALPRVVNADHPLRVDLFFVPAVSR
jgi:hypothetical protein